VSDGSDDADDVDQPAFAAEVEREEARPFPWKAVVKRAVVIAIAGVAIYLVLPKVIVVLGAWPRLSTLEPAWFAVAVGAELAHFMCTFTLQRMALRTKGWFSVITAQLAGNSISLIMAGGAAAGAAVQFRMLARSEPNATDTVGGLTAFSLLGVGGLLALPVFALPVVLFGAPVNRGLYNAAILGAIGFVIFAGLGALVLSTEAPLRWSGRTVQRVRIRVFKKRTPMTDLDTTLIHQRNLIREVLGKKWWQAVLLSAGRLGFDYYCLLASVRATGSHPRPSLILIAYAVAGIIGLIPITPGGLGIVEASLTGLLILAGVPSGEAFLATLTYRLASYWLPLAAGPVAYGLFRYRYRGAPDPPPQAGTVAA